MTHCCPRSGPYTISKTGLSLAGDSDAKLHSLTNPFAEANVSNVLDRASATLSVSNWHTGCSRTNTDVVAAQAGQRSPCSLSYYRNRWAGRYGFDLSRRRHASEGAVLRDKRSLR